MQGNAIWGPLRGDGQTCQGGGLVSLRLPGFEKAANSPQLGKQSTDTGT